MNSSTLESKKVPGSRPHRQGGQYGSPKGSPTPCHRPAQALYTPGAFSKQKKNTDSQAKQTATAADSPETFLTQGSVPKLFIETEIVSKKSEITKLQMVEEVGNLMGYQDLESGLKNNEERNSIPSDDNNLENGVKKVTNISLIDAISVNNELGDNGVKNNSLSDLVTEKSGAVCINSNCGNVTNCLQSSSSLGQVHVNNFDCPPGSVRYKVGNAMSDICEDSCCKDSKIDEIKSNIEQNETNDDCNCFISVPDTIFNAKETEQPESNQALNNVNKNVDNLKLIMNECKENDDSQKKRASLNDNKIQPRNGKGLAAIESERGYEGNQNQKIVNEEGPVKNKGGCRINGGDKIIETQGMLGDEKDKTFQDNNECIGKSKGNERTESTFDDDFFVEEINVTVEIVNKKLQPKSKRQNRKEKKAKKRQENLNEAKTKFKEAAMNEERLMRTEDEARGLGNKKKNNQDIQKKNEEDKQVPHEGGETHDLGEKANNEPKVTKEKTESKGGTVLYLGQKSSSTEGTENVGEENSFDKKGEILHSVKKGKSGKKGKQKNANAIISKGNGAVESGNRGKCSKEAKSGKEKLVSTDDETKSKVLNSEKNGANDQVAKKIKVKVDQKTAGKSTMTKRGELGEQPTTSTGVDDVKMEQSGDRILNQKEESDSSGEDWEKTWTDDGECLSEELLAEVGIMFHPTLVWNHVLNFEYFKLLVSFIPILWKTITSLLIYCVFSWCI